MATGQWPKHCNDSERRKEGKGTVVRLTKRRRTLEPVPFNLGTKLSFAGERNAKSGS